MEKERGGSARKKRPMGRFVFPPLPLQCTRTRRGQDQPLGKCWEGRHELHRRESLAVTLFRVVGVVAVGGRGGMNTHCKRSALYGPRSCDDDDHGTATATRRGERGNSRNSARVSFPSLQRITFNTALQTESGVGHGFARGGWGASCLFLFPSALNCWHRKFLNRHPRTQSVDIKMRALYQNVGDIWCVGLS